MGGFIKKIFLYIAIGLMSSGHLYAASVRLNSGGGLNASDGLHTYIDDTTQIQVRRLNNTGQLYNPNAIPSNTQLDNGIYLRANNGLIGPDHFGFPSTLTPTAYINRTVSTPAPAVVSQGVTQSSTSQFSAPRFSTLVAGPSVTVNWKYTYPLDYITAEVTLVIPVGYPISSSNPVRYYHAVDTYLGGDDRGCGVRYVDTNGKQIVGTYPLSGGTNAPCPSSSSLPANLDVVESFRERNRSFDHYCVGAWDSFWSSSNNACAIAKTNSLSDTISTTKIDTGIAIEYDFILPGTYTFSYDFVVGSTFVPNYDHLEVRHSGTGTLCPVDIKVLACLSSAVPCPDNQLVTTGALTGNLTVSPSTPTVTATPDSTFTIGSDGPIDTVSITGSSAATYTLGAGGLSKAPLSGVKCWNTTTNSQSCSFTFTNTPCVDTFECMENSQASYNNLKTTPSARNPLYTKVWNMNFDMDIVAVLANGSQSTGYNSTSGLIVDLVIEDNNSCGSTVVATQTVPFSSTDAGRKKITFTASATNMTNGTYPKGVYPNLRCKIRDNTLNKSGCSSDNFALRPQSFAIGSTSANFIQTTVSPTVTLPRKAWMDNFNLSASTGEVNYTGIPQILASRVFSHNGTVSLGKFGYGIPIPTASPPYIPPETTSFPQAINGVSNGNNFLYGEVGFFRFDQYGVYDETFAAVDTAKGDCNNEAVTNPDSSFNPNSFNNNGIKNGCRFGNTSATNFLGRFIPDHFRIATGTVVKACSTFTYYGQDVSNIGGVSIPFTILAENGANGVTQYYTGVPATGVYAKFSPSTWTNYKFTTTPNLGSGDALRSASNPTLPAGWTNGQVSVDAKFKIDRPAVQTVPQNVTFYAEVSDSDGVATAPTKIALNNNTQFRYGRLAIPPVHGSERLPLPLRIEAQYWDGSSVNSYRRSSDDNCTKVLPSTVVMRNYLGNLNPCETQLGGGAMAYGISNLQLSAPGVGGDGRPNTGSVDLEVNLGTALAGERTCTGPAEANATSGVIPWFGGPDPVGRATFGVYKSPIIYMRENFGP